MTSPRLWEIWKNPLIVRGCRARLRLKPIAVWTLVVLTACLFTCTLTYLLVQHARHIEDPARRVILGARAALIPLLVIQGVVLMILGTGTVASGISTDRDRQLTDYHRITPLPPSHCMLGHLLGLPAREYFLFLLTVPFAIWIMFVGEIALLKMLHLYGMFLVSVWLYHATGLFLGMLYDSRRRVAMSVQGIVIGLYLILPALSEMGFSFFEFLTVRPTLRGLFYEELAELGRGSQRFAKWQSVPFFEGHIHPTLYALLMQGGLLATFLIASWRKWRSPESHAMGKVYALGFYAVLQTLLLGSLWPMLFKGQFYSTLISNLLTADRNDFVAAAFLYLHGLIGLIVAGLLVFAMSPSQYEHVAGLRRAHRFGWPHIPRGSDAATAWPQALGLMAMFSAGWITIRWNIGAGGGFFPFAPTAWDMTMLLALGAATLLAVHGATERWGGRGLFLYIFVAWVIPLMLGVLLIAFGGDRGAILAAYAVSTPSPITGLGFAVSALMHINIDPVPDDQQSITHLARALTGASTFWLMLCALFFTRAAARSRRQWREREHPAIGLSGR